MQFWAGSAGDPAGLRWDFGEPGSGAANAGHGQYVAHRYARGGTYPVRLTLADGRVLTETVTVAPLPGDFTHENIFTPNGDGLNDVFIPVREALPGGRLRVFGRWGQAVFSTTDPALRWDGAGAASGDYFYLLEYPDCRGQMQRRKGNVTLSKVRRCIGRGTFRTTTFHSAKESTTTIRSTQRLKANTLSQRPFYFSKTMKYFFFLLCFFRLFTALAQPAASTVVVPGQPGVPTNISALSRGPDPSVRFQRVAALYRPDDVRGISAGLNLLSLGFRLRTPANTPATGTLRLWLLNTTHQNYLLNNTWASFIAAPVAFTQVYNGPLTIPALAGWYDVAFQTPFAYTGGGFYLAYEWETTAPVGASGSYECNDRLYQGLRGGTSATAFPAQLATVASFRPQLRVGYTTPAQDAAIDQIYGPGKVARQTCVAPWGVQAVVRNAGSQPLLNLPVTFTPGAGAGRAATVTVAALAPGAQATVRVPGLDPAAGTDGQYVRYTVSVPPDQNPANNIRADTTLVTTNALTYVKGFPSQSFGTGNIGFNSPTAPSGTLLCRYPLRATALVASVIVRIDNNATSAGNTIFAVVLDEQGHLLSRSADVVLTPSQLGPWLTIPLPAPVRVSGRAFFAGLAQTRPRAAGQWYYPLSTQVETPAGTRLITPSWAIRPSPASSRRAN